MKSKLPIYPLLFGIYPVLGLLSANISQIPLYYGLRSLLVALVFGVLVYGLLLWRMGDYSSKAALLALWLLLTFYSYGHVYGALEGATLGGWIIGRHRFLIVIWGIIFLLGVWLIEKKVLLPEKFTTYLTWMGLTLVILPILQIALFEMTRSNTVMEDMEENNPTITSELDSTEYLPDVYYIILDAYTRDDMMLTYHDLDNSEFIQNLQDLGFYLPVCTQSNYGITSFSLASSLNMNYLDAIDPHAVDVEANWVVFSELIIHSRVRQSFEDLGYNIVSFESGVWWDELTDADYYITRGQNSLNTLTNFRQVSDFEVLFLRTTALRVLEEASGAWLEPLLAEVGTPEEDHADRILFELDQLGSVASLPSPKFVFAHLVAPHSPFVFDVDGTIVQGVEAIPGYANEVQYLNSRVIPMVEEIIANSEVPPIIILQGDHGQDNENRMAILNAYYFPNGGSAELYPTVTPVNTFRLIFNTYFGQNLPLLPDISWYSMHADVYNFQEFTHPCDLERYSQ